MISNRQLVFIVFTNLIAATVISCTPPIAQPISYHQFSDTNTIFGIPNFWNVLSNLPYLASGALLLKYAIQSRNMELSVWILGISLSLVSIGSSYYHWQPNTASLFWDRLPIVIGFMALFNLFLKDYFSIKIAKALFWPSMSFAIFALLYWRYTEQMAQGDMRAYLLVQIVPILTMFFSILILRSHRLTPTYALLLASYVLAKGFELVDHFQVEQWLVASGHTWKHLISGAGLVLFAQQYIKMRRGSQEK